VFRIMLSHCHRRREIPHGWLLEFRGERAKCNGSRNDSLKFRGVACGRLATVMWNYNPTAQGRRKNIE